MCSIVAVAHREVTYERERERDRSERGQEKRERERERGRHREREGVSWRNDKRATAPGHMIHDDKHLTDPACLCFLIYSILSLTLLMCFCMYSSLSLIFKAMTDPACVCVFAAVQLTRDRRASDAAEQARIIALSA